ncbi:MAG: DNA polymerase III subunit beta [Syntrophomonadaceae bacterium]|nr:DNA polymerase III subunit beta [Bacillota bacterium]
MFIKAPKEKFISMLNIIQNAVSTKTSMQQLNNFYIGVKGNVINISATDLEIFVEAKFDLSDGEKEKVELKDGECTIPAKRFIDMVKEQEAGKLIEVKVDEKFRVDVRCGRSHFNLPGISSKEYPEPLEFPKQKIISLPAVLLKEMIEKTIFAASVEDVRYALNGVYFVVDKSSSGTLKSTLKLISTDSRRLAFAEGVIDAAKFAQSVIVPQKALHELSRLMDLSPDASDVKIGFSDNQISFGINAATLSSRLIDGEFPNYERVIPKESQIAAKIKSKELLTALKQLQFLAQDKSSAVKFLLKKNLLTIIASVQGIGHGEVELDIDYSDKPLEIVFNLNFLVDFLKIVHDGEIKMDLISAVNPVVFSVASLEATPQLKKYLYIVMPIRTE